MVHKQDDYYSNNREHGALSINDEDFIMINKDDLITITMGLFFFYALSQITKFVREK